MTDLITTSTQETALAKASEQKKMDSITHNTKRAYIHAVTHFLNWCEGIGQPAQLNGNINDVLTHTGKRFHATAPESEKVAHYMVFLDAQGKSPASISSTLTAIKFFAKNTGTPVDFLPIETTVKGIKRDKEAQTRGRGSVDGVQRDVMEHRLLVKIAEDGHTKRALRDAAIIRVMSDGLLRLSETCAITVNDIETRPDGSGVLNIRHSKTDQEGKGATLYLGNPTIDAIRKWQAASSVYDGFLFRRVWGKNGKVGDDPITPDGIRKMIKERAQDAGIDARVSGHSLRIGSAESLAEKGATLVQLQNAGRWSDSQMPAHYTRKQSASKGAVAKLFYNQ